MKYALLAFSLLLAPHGFAMQEPTKESPTTTTSSLKKSTHRTSIMVALMHGAAPIDALKQMVKDRLFGQQQ